MTSKLMRIIAAGSFLVSAAVAMAQSQINGVTVDEGKDSVTVLVKGSDLGKPKEIRVPGTRTYSYLLEFDASLKIEPDRQQIRNGGVSFVSWSWFTNRPPKVRIHLRVDEERTPTLTKTELGWLVEFPKSGEASKPLPILMKPINATRGPKVKDDVQTSSEITVFAPGVEEDIIVKVEPIEKAPAQVTKAASKTMATKETPKTEPAKPEVKKPEVKTSQPSKPVSAKPAPKLQVVKTKPQTAPSKPEPLISLLPEIKPKATKTAQAATFSPSPAPTPVAAIDLGSIPVSLDFVNAEIVQILKALAMQANVNVVTSPDVRGQLTVALDSTTVREALDVITGLAGVRYQLVGRTYVVTTAERFAQTLQLIDRQVGGNETRVVPVFSGQAAQIKTAILKMLPVSTNDGRYELLLPSDKVAIKQSSSLVPTSNKAGKEDAGEKENAQSLEVESGDAAAALKDDYVVVVGTPRRLDEVQDAIAVLDRQIGAALGKTTPRSNALVTKTYRPNGVDAEALVKTLTEDGKRPMAGIELWASPKTSGNRQVVVVSGRETEVSKVINVLNELDAVVEPGEMNIEVVGLMHISPTYAQVELMRAITGLRVTLMPLPVDPLVGFSYSEKDQQKSSMNQTDPNAAKQTSSGEQSNGGSSGGGQGNSKKGWDKDDTGVGLTIEPSTMASNIPMRLLLQGTPDQISMAKRHLTAIDIAPKQVALELRVVEMGKEDIVRLGVDWNLLTGGAVKFAKIAYPNLGGGSVGAGINNSKVSGDVTAFLDANIIKNKILARPNITAQDDQPQRLFVGDVVRFVESIQSSQNGTTVTTGKVNIGVGIALVPRIGSNNSVTLSLSGAVTFLKGFTTVPGGGQLPQTSERRLDQTLTFADGDTFAIGGLIQDQDRKDMSGIPLLMDLPILGNFFRKSTTTKTRTELIIFVTAKVLDNPPYGTDSKTLPMQIQPTLPSKKGGN